MRDEVVPEGVSEELQFRIEGPDARNLAGELREILESELATPVTSRTESSPAGGSAMRSGDPLTVAALVLSLPGALLAAADLAQRLELKEKADRLLQRLRNRTAKSLGHRVEVVDAEGRGRSVETLDSDELLEISIELRVQVRRRVDR